MLETELRDKTQERCGEVVAWFAQLFGEEHRRMPFSFGSAAIRPPVLLRLIRLAYHHVRIVDDERHSGSYSPDTRDHAENGRNAILNALLLTTGDEGWHAKLQLAEDPLFLHFKDRALFLAREKLAEEADAVAWTDGDIISLERYGEAPPSTRDAMFAIMRDRLDDLDDLLLRDYSPREAWAGYNDERLMRRELARTFHDASNHLYTVDQEGATADEKETDVRLRSTAPPQQAVIEVKIGDDRWSGAVLRATLQDQIVNKYMAPEVCRVGCLLVTIPSDRHWVHPDTGERLDLAALIKMLNEEAERLVKKSGNTIRLMVKGLDLRPRLKREK
jgi:hypothetical protein